MEAATPAGSNSRCLQLIQAGGFRWSQFHIPAMRVKIWSEDSCKWERASVIIELSMPDNNNTKVITSSNEESLYQVHKVWRV